MAPMRLEDAERLLLSLELFGMRFGLDRMRRLLTALGSPQERFASIHVVGTNGKSSTVRMTAAILRRHGLRVGSYLSPHLVSFAERVRIDDADVSGAEFAAAIQRAAAAAEKVDRTAPSDDHVTQFELLTAAALDCFARAERRRRGGRGGARRALRRHQRAAVVGRGAHQRRPGAHALARADGRRHRHREARRRRGRAPRSIVGADLHPDALALAEQTARERHATLRRRARRPRRGPGDPGPRRRSSAATSRWRSRRRGRTWRRTSRELDDAAVRAAAASTLVPGRFEVVAQQAGHASSTAPTTPAAWPRWPRR